MSQERHRRVNDTTILVSHGFADSAAAWTPVVASLQRRHTAQAWDLPGHGERAGHTSDFSRQAVEVELRERIMGSGRACVLMGHSAGGYLSMRIAVQEPRLVHSLVLIAAGPGFRKPERMAAWNDQIARLVTATGMPTASAALVEMHDSLVLDHLDRITCPVLVVVGSQDRPQYIDGANFLAQRLTTARLVTIDGAAHDPHRTHPEELAGTVADFVGAHER